MVQKLSTRVVPHRTRGREEKWRVSAAPREKRGRAFLRKVGREGTDRIQESVLRSTREIHKERRRVVRPRTNARATHPVDSHGHEEVLGKQEKEFYTRRGTDRASFSRIVAPLLFLARSMTFQRGEPASDNACGTR